MQGRGPFFPCVGHREGRNLHGGIHPNFRDRLHACGFPACFSCTVAARAVSSAGVPGSVSMGSMRMRLGRLNGWPLYASCPTAQNAALGFEHRELTSIHSSAPCLPPPIPLPSHPSRLTWRRPTCGAWPPAPQTGSTGSKRRLRRGSEKNLHERERNPLARCDHWTFRPPTKWKNQKLTCQTNNDLELGRKLLSAKFTTNKIFNLTLTHSQKKAKHARFASSRASPGLLCWRSLEACRIHLHFGTSLAQHLEHHHTGRSEAPPLCRHIHN